MGILAMVWIELRTQCDLLRKCWWESRLRSDDPELRLGGDLVVELLSHRAIVDALEVLDLMDVGL